MEVDFTVLTDLPDCRKINVKNFESIESNYKRNEFKKPVNQFECERQGCVNSGTLYLEEAGMTVTYKGQFDSKEVAAGLMTFYAIPDGASSKIQIELSNDANFVNCDVYEVTVNSTEAGADGFVPIVVDFTKAPTAEIGSGWTGAESALYVRFCGIEGKKATISSIAFYESVEDFEVNDVVKIGCLSSLWS